MKWIGAHLSSAGGPHNAISAAHQINASCCALFLKNQRTFKCPPPLSDEAVASFTQTCTRFHIDPETQIVPHGSYLINLANPLPEKQQMMQQLFLDDLQRCERLGIGLYNFHPGSATEGTSKSAAIEAIATAINKAHSQTASVITLLENMAGQGKVIGSTFEELAQVISLVQDKSRIGICLDTCHLYAAGYDIVQDFAGVMEQFDSQIGLGYLKAVHLNDSVHARGSHKDRHANIGKGEIGLEPFRFIMNSGIFEGMPMVLETPVVERGYGAEVALLRSLVKAE